MWSGEEFYAESSKMGFIFSVCPTDTCGIFTDFIGWKGDIESWMEQWYDLGFCFVRSMKWDFPFVIFCLKMWHVCFTLHYFLPREKNRIFILSVILILPLFSNGFSFWYRFKYETLPYTSDVQFCLHCRIFNILDKEIKSCLSWWKNCVQST